jgi:hypothetical protein
MLPFKEAPMIRHIVFMDIKSDLPTSDREALFAQIRSMSEISSVRKLEVAKLLHAREAWYDERINKDYAYALYIEFDDEDGLYTYQNHPLHVKTAPEIRKCSNSVRIVDFVS